MSGLNLADCSFYYDGTSKSLAVTGTLPPNATITYTQNNRTEVGSQTVTALIEAPQYAPLSLNAQLQILPIEITGIQLTHNRFTYDGKPKSLSIEGTLPEGATVL